MSRFLQFVVDEALKGDADRLKEYVIGVEVFDRDEQYDPRVDSIVRVEAGRLRIKIQEYYNGPGDEDVIIIQLPKGSYSPKFVRRDLIDPQDIQNQKGPDKTLTTPPSQPAARVTAFFIILVAVIGLIIAAWQAEFQPGQDSASAAPVIRIAVLPFHSSSNSEADQNMASRVTQRVTAELVRIGRLGVVSSTSALQFKNYRGSLRDVAKALNADLLMEAQLFKEHEDTRVEIRIIAGALDQKFLVDDSFVGPDLDELAREIAISTTDIIIARQKSGDLPQLRPTQTPK